MQYAAMHAKTAVAKTEAGAHLMRFEPRSGVPAGKTKGTDDDYE
jgi:hypothetical protein